MTSSTSRIKESVVPRVVSFIVLLAILMLMGAVFFQVMAHFVVPLFLAAVLVVVFKPLHAWVLGHVPGYPRIAALATTLLILLAVLLPTAWLGWNAVVEARDLYSYLSARQTKVVGPSVPGPTVDGEAMESPSSGVPASPSGATSAGAMPSGSGPARPTIAQTIVARAPQQFKELYLRLVGHEFDEERIKIWTDKTRGVLGAVAVSGAQIAIKLLFGMAIMVLAIYYFLADGPKMLASMMKLSPLDDMYERELLDKFANISRAVVVASLASAVAQGLLAGLGYAFALESGAPIFLLTMLTMVLAIVPFAGAASIWVPTVIWIYFYQPVYENGKVLLEANGVDPVRGDTFTAICLAIYGVCVVSAIDNVIKPLVLHGQSNLHPLVALISILGGVQTLGPIGILVGPMLVAFIQALLNMINKELVRLGDGTLDSKTGARGAPISLDPAATAEAQAVGLTSGSVVDKLAISAALADQPPAPASAPETTDAPTSKRRRRRRST